VRTVLAVLQAARPDDVRPEHLPVLPSWFPLDPEAELPLSPEQRKAGRHAAALKEARRGPCDGTRGEVVVLAAGPPALLRVYDNGWAYRLIEQESTPEHVTYRYSPADSPQHLTTMLVVAEAYRERGPDYVQSTRDDQPVHDGITAIQKD
jgi:hypothetical protein